MCDGGVAARVGVGPRFPTAEQIRDELRSAATVFGPEELDSIVSNPKSEILNLTVDWEHSPPRRGGVAATSIKFCEATADGADGVVSSAISRGCRSSIEASPCRARGSRHPVCAALVAPRHLLMAQLLLRLRPAGLALRALLCEEGNVTVVEFRERFRKCAAPQGQIAVPGRASKFLPRCRCGLRPARAVPSRSCAERPPAGRVEVTTFPG